MIYGAHGCHALGCANGTEMPQLRREFSGFGGHLGFISKMHTSARDIMLKSMRSRPLAIALICILTGTTAAVAAIRIAPKPTTDSVTIHSEKPDGEVVLTYQDGTIALNRNCRTFPCKLDLSALPKGEYNVMIRTGTDIKHMSGLYKE